MTDIQQYKTVVSIHAALFLMLTAFSGEALAWGTLPPVGMAAASYVDVDEAYERSVRRWISLSLMTQFAAVVWTAAFATRVSAVVCGVVLCTLILVELYGLRGKRTKVNLGNEYPWHVTSGRVSGECQVCMEDLTKGCVVAKATNCMHEFHDECLRKWYDQTTAVPSCPLCRSDLRVSPIKRCQQKQGDAENVQAHKTTRRISVVVGIVLLIVAQITEESALQTQKTQISRWVDGATSVPCQGERRQNVTKGMLIFLSCPVENNNTQGVFRTQSVEYRGLLVRRKQYVCRSIRQSVADYPDQVTLLIVRIVCDPQVY